MSDLFAEARLHCTMPVMSQLLGLMSSFRAPLRLARSSMWYSSCSASLRTQTRPAIELVSGEEGLRPKSYFFEFSFLDYFFKDCGKRRDGDVACFVVLALHGRAVHQMLSPVFLLSARGVMLPPTPFQGEGFGLGR